MATAAENGRGGVLHEMHRRDVLSGRVPSCRTDRAACGAVADAASQSNAPGFIYDGARCNYAAEVLAEIAKGARTNEPRDRPVEIELRPVPAAKEVAA